jgi:hypothetical protein
VLSESLSWQETTEALQGFDANLRLTAGKVEWQGQALEGVALDATLDAGRLSLQRFSARQGSASLSASGIVSLGAAPSLTDAALEIAAPMASALPPLLSEALNLPAGLAALPATLRLRGNGTMEALSLAGEALLEDARLDANAVLDLPKAQGQGKLYLADEAKKIVAAKAAKKAARKLRSTG